MVKRIAWLGMACLLGGLMVVALASGLRAQVRAAEATAPQAPTASPGDVVINEVAWMGTEASSSDEWIELYNNTDSPIDIASWSISGADMGICLNFSSADGYTTTVVPAHGYLIYANHDDDVENSGGQGIVDIWDATIGLNDTSPGQIILYDASDCGGSVIDTANQTTGNWFAGDSASKRTMERKSPVASGTDGANWATNDPNMAKNGQDASGSPISGTAKAQNSCYQPPAKDVADLIVVKTGPVTATAGSTITYHITLSNTGATTATGTLVTDTLPIAVDFITQTSDLVFTHTGRNLYWQIGAIPTGTLHTITITAQVTGTASGTLTNLVTATTTASETITANNAGSWETTVFHTIYLYALAPANYEGSGESAALINLNPFTVSLSGWWLNDDPGSGGVSFPTTATIAPGQILWLAQNADDFYPAWGFDADWAAEAITRPALTLDGSWPGFTDDGEYAYLLDGDSNIIDALTYGDRSTGESWQGLSVPYKYSGYASGQVIYRKLDQSTGLPVPDTNTAADWAQDSDDPINGRKLRYPGWDLEELFFPAEVTSTANFTLAVAPEGALAVVSQTIASAQHALRIEAYSLKSVALYQVINDRILAGVAVTILLESGPGRGIDDAEKWIVHRLHNPPTSTVYFIGKTTARWATVALWP
jgi:uncharacterized repeat protein (TIGR01451 family)